jgi:signal transduction histidine kinase
VRDHQALARDRGVEIAFNNVSNLPKSAMDYILKSDEYRFKQIFGNILSNAIKYSHGKVRLSLQVGDGLWELHVEDNGPGVSDKEAIFDLFQREGESLKQGSKDGTGVGLTFVKYLCEDLGFKYRLKTSRLGGLDFMLTKQTKD